MRTKHGNRPKKVTNVHLQNVRDHIKSFPRVASHYSCSSNNNKRYLKEGLSIHRMYQHYLKKFKPTIAEHEGKVHRAHQEQQRPPQPLRPKVSYRKYLELLNTECTLGFGRPRSDTQQQIADRNSNRFLFREKHRRNFGWGAEIDCDGRKIMVHHPYEVWMRRSFSSEEPWIKVCLLERESIENNVISSPPAQLYQSQIPL